VDNLINRLKLQANENHNRVSWAVITEPTIYAYPLSKINIKRKLYQKRKQIERKVRILETK